MNWKLEVVVIPVSDVDRAKQFYVETLGFHLDVDVRPTPELRVVQLTPPGSACSVTIGPVLISDDLDEMLTWGIKRGARYMGEEQGEAFGRRNSVAGELLVRLTPEHTVAIANLAD